MAGRKRHDKKRRKQEKSSSPQNRSSRLSLEMLRQDFTDPKRLQHSMDHLLAMLQHEPDMAALRFPPEKLMTALDDLAETASDEIETLSDPLQQRVTILNRTIGPFLTRSFTHRVEKVLLNRLENSRDIPRDFRAVSAGLYFLEIHNRQGAEPGENPLWNLIFDLSYEEATVTAGGAIQPPVEPIPPEREHVDMHEFLDLFDVRDGTLSEDGAATVQQALDLIATGAVELGFALDTILLGLQVWVAPQTEPAINRLQSLRETFPREIGVRQWNDMTWGLDYAATHLTGEKKHAFEVVLKAVRLIPPRENPVVFALYYRSISEYLRFVSVSEAPLAEAIATAPGVVEPVLELGRYLLTIEAPHRALNAFIAATVVDPSDETARLGAGIACWMTESYREARLHWDRAARLWSGYLPKNHPNLQVAHELMDLDELADIPQKAYNSLFFKEPFEGDTDYGKIDTDSDPI